MTTPGTSSPRHRLHTFLTVLAAAWLFAFAWESVRIGRLLLQLHNGNDQAESLTRGMTTASHHIADKVDKINSESQEIEYLQSLVDVLPQEKAYLRTQRAIADEVDDLRAKVGRRLHGELHILVDSRANKLYVKKGLMLLWQADCSVGRGGVLRDRETGRRWEFVTPRGQFEVLYKIENPVWTKPDWAFVEEHKPVPPPNDPTRKVPGELGAYALNLGDGYLIHGTKSEDVLGHPVSHGCVRLGAVDLKKLYETVPRGTRVFIY